MLRGIRNIIAATMMLLILFSTVGFNIISTFCDGCNNEHTELAFSIEKEDISCNCCSAETEYESCCASTKEHRDNHHKTESTFAKLKFDSPEAKSKTLITDVPVFLIEFTSVLFNFEAVDNTRSNHSIYNLPPSLSGRTILSLICVLRN